MAPRDSRRGGGQNRNKRDADLTCLLTEDEKAELLKLVRSIIGRMHHRIARVFNLVPEIDPTPTHFHTHGHEGFWQLVSLVHILPAADRNKENEPDILPSDAALHNAHTAPELKAEEALHREEAEALTPGRLGELKKEVVVYFRKWNTNVTKRLADITASRNSTSNPKIVPKSSVASIRAKAAEAAGFLSPSLDYDRTVMEHFPPINSPLVSLPDEKRALILHSMFLLVLSLDHYTSYSRVFLLYLTASLNLPLGVLIAEEMRIARGISDNIPDYSPDELAQKRSEEAKNVTTRRTRFGANTIKGVAHALAAPLMAAGLGSVLGIGIGNHAAATLLGHLSHSQISACNLFGLIGARPGAKSIMCCAKDIQDFALVPLHGANKDDYHDGRAVNPKDRRMRFLICIDGWIDGKTDTDDLWDCIGDNAESFVMKWELETLTKVGSSLQTIIRSVSWKKAKNEIIERTCTSGREQGSESSCKDNTDINMFKVAKVLKEAEWPRDLMKISKVVDNPWSIGMVRADKAGAALADIIINRGHGERSVNLIGYSLGARVIYTCLMILAERRVFGMIESVVMIGTPAPADSRVWCALRTIVAGRIVNVFSESDYMLGFLYRTSSTQFGIAGLEEIQGANGVENLDVSHMVRGHLRYQSLVSTILKMLAWENLQPHEASEDVCSVATCDEKHTDILITEFNTKRGITNKIKTVEETRPEFAPVTKLKPSTLAPAVVINGLQDAESTQIAAVENGAGSDKGGSREPNSRASSIHSQRSKSSRPPSISKSGQNQARGPGQIRPATPNQNSRSAPNPRISGQNMARGPGQNQNIPRGPGHNMPRGPGQNMPQGPGQNMPRGPGQNMTRGPGQNIPRGPGQNGLRGNRPAVNQNDNLPNRNRPNGNLPNGNMARGRQQQQPTQGVSTEPYNNNKGDKRLGRFGGRN